MMRSPNLMLVEGIDDVHLVLHLLYQHGFKKGQIVAPEKFVLVPDGGTADAAVQVKDKDGYEKLAGEVRLEVTPTYLRSIAVIVDADSDVNARWRSLRGRLEEAGYTGLPAAPGREGTVLIQTGKPTLGVWVMPDNQSNGFLEDYISRMIAAGDVLWPRSQDCVDQIPEAERRFSPKHSGKAKIHTWLAWQQEPGTRMGAAVTRRYLDPGCASALLFVGWVRRWLGI